MLKTVETKKTWLLTCLRFVILSVVFMLFWFVYMSDPGLNTTLGPLDLSCDRMFEDVIRQARTEMSRTVTIVESNSGFQPMLDNWLYHVNQVSPSALRSLVIVALDKALESNLRGRGFRVYFDDCETDNNTISSQAEGFRTASYNKIVFHKWKISLDGLRTGTNVMLSDADVVWLRDPLPIILESYSGCDFLFTTDDPMSSQKPSWHNTGFVFFSSTPSTIQVIELFQLWTSEHAEELKGYDDQHAWKEFLTKSVTSTNMTVSHCEVFVLRIDAEKNLSFSMAILPSSSFMDHKHWVEESTEFQRSAAITLHYNWLNGFENKKRAMNKNHHWFLAK